MGSKFEDLVGKTIVRIDKMNDEALYFHTDDGIIYNMSHWQKYIARFNIESIIGDLNNLIGNPILRAEVLIKGDHKDDELWTFYKLHTNKGEVVIRWYCDTSEVNLQRYSVEVTLVIRNKCYYDEEVLFYHNHGHKHEIYNGE